MSYHPPTNHMVIQDHNGTFQGHKDRRPPSTEPGTDLATPMNSPVYAVHDGVIAETKLTNSGAMGRKIGLNADMGRAFNYLHLQRVFVSRGQRVKVGDLIGRTGASGWGSDRYYGPHLHVTVWATHHRVYTTNAPLNFETLYMNGGSSSGSGGGSKTHPLIGVEMEDYVLVAGDSEYKAGDVYYTYPGYLKKFKNQKDYEAWREIREKQKRNGQTNRMVPPTLGSLEKLPDWRAKAIFDANGVKG